MDHIKQNQNETKMNNSYFLCSYSSSASFHHLRWLQHWEVKKKNSKLVYLPFFSALNVVRKNQVIQSRERILRDMFFQSNLNSSAFSRGGNASSRGRELLMRSKPKVKNCNAKHARLDECEKPLLPDIFHKIWFLLCFWFNKILLEFSYPPLVFLHSSHPFLEIFNRWRLILLLQYYSLIQWFSCSGWPCLYGDGLQFWHQLWEVPVCVVSNMESSTILSRTCWI